MVNRNPPGITDPGYSIIAFARRSNRDAVAGIGEDRKSTRLNSSHSQISYAVFCLKKKNALSISPPTRIANSYQRPDPSHILFRHTTPSNHIYCGRTSRTEQKHAALPTAQRLDHVG